MLHKNNYIIFMKHLSINVNVFDITPKNKKEGMKSYPL